MHARLCALLFAFASSSAALKDTHLEGRSRDAARPVPTTGVSFGEFAWFEPNRGQSPSEVEVVGRGAGVTALASAGRMALLGSRGGAVGMVLHGVPSAARWSLEGPRPGASNYFVGSNSTKWVRGVPQFARAVLRDAGTGVDLELREERGRIAYGLRGDPGAPSRFRFSFEGSTGLELAADGGLLVRCHEGDFHHSKPVAWQETGEGRRAVDAQFRIEGPARVDIVLGELDPRYPFVVDPTIDFSTTLGGSSDDTGVDSGISGYILDGQNLVAADSSGNAYLTGITNSTNFPVTASAFDKTYNGNFDLFVTKVRLDPPALLYATFVGSNNTDAAWCIGVDGSGQACVGGDSSHNDFPVTSGVFQTTKAAYNDAVVFKLTADGSGLVFSTFLGGGQGDFPRAIACDSSGAVVVAGATASGYAGSASFPTSGAIQASFAGGSDLFVTKLSADGSSLVFSTYYGGSVDEVTFGLCVDSSGNVFVTGVTSSSDFPTATPFQGSRAGKYDAFLLKLPPNGASATFATYFGGSEDDAGTGVAVDGSGAVYLGGSTRSSNFPTASALQGTLKGTMDAFVAKFNAAGSALVYSTFLGGSDIERGFGLGVTSDGRAVVAGETRSTDFPTVSAFKVTKAALTDGFVSKLSPSGAALSWSSYYGGNGNDYCRGVALSGNATVCLGGFTTSTDFHSVRPLSMANPGGIEMYLMALTGATVAPTNLTAMAVSSSRVDLAWDDNSLDETGFEIERAVPPSGFFKITTTGPGANSYSDTSVVGDTTYDYRVRSATGEGASAPSNVASVTTPPGPPGPPLPPSDLVATVQGPTGVLLEWSDNSDSETFFQLTRKSGTQAPVTLATPSADAESYVDPTVLPSRTYTYGVKSGNGSGLSLGSNDATVTLPPTLACIVTKGQIGDSPKPGRDKVRLSLALSRLEGAIGSSFDPTVGGFQLRLGDWEAPPLLQVSGTDEGWEMKKGRWRWKSPRGSLGKAAIVIDPATGLVQVSVKKITLGAPLVEHMTLTVGFGQDGVIFGADGTLRKPQFWTVP